MKKIEAIIKPSRVEEVKVALGELGIHRMTTTEVKGFGRGGGHIEVYRSSEYTIDSIPNIKIELVVTDEQLEAAVMAIVKPGETGRKGGDEIFVSTIELAA